MKRLIITTILLTAVLAIQAQWSQKIVEKKTETGKTSVSMIHYEDSIGYLYFDEGMNSVFYIGNNLSIEFAVNKAASVKKVTGKIELYSENDELVETIEGYQFVAEEEYITLFSDKLNAKGASQYRTTKASSTSPSTRKAMCASSFPWLPARPSISRFRASVFAKEVQKVRSEKKSRLFKTNNLLFLFLME